MGQLRLENTYKISSEFISDAYAQFESGQRKDGKEGRQLKGLWEV